MLDIFYICKQVTKMGSIIIIMGEGLLPRGGITFLAEGRTHDWQSTGQKQRLDRNWKLETIEEKSLAARVDSERSLVHTLILFQTNIYHFPCLFSDLA